MCSVLGQTRPDGRELEPLGVGDVYLLEGCGVADALSEEVRVTERQIYVAIAVLAMAALLNGGCARRPTPTASPPPTAVNSPLPTPPQSPVPAGVTEVPTVPPDVPIRLPWTEAEELILNGDVQRVVQTHDRDVTLYLVDGRVVQTVEPEIDDVFRVIERCGELCSEVERITE
jgi:hypothetical protein